MKDIVTTKDLIAWCNEAMNWCDKEIRYWQGQKEGILSVRRSFSDEMEVKE